MGEQIVTTADDTPDPEPGGELVQLPARAAPAPVQLGYGVETVPTEDEMRGLAAMAVTLAGARIVPRDLQDRPNDVFLILLTGRELGIAPTAALRACYVVDGKVTLAPKLRVAMVRQRGIGRIWPCQGPRREPCKSLGCEKANDHESATWHASRADEDHAYITDNTFTIADAHRAEHKPGTPLADKSNWKSYPQRMLTWRACGYLLDEVFPEVGTGLYSADELGAATDEDGSVIDVREVPPMEGMTRPAGHKAGLPPDPRDLPLPDEAKAELRRRIDALASYPDANKDGKAAQAVLHDLWTARQTIPPLTGLVGRHLPLVEAMIRTVELRAEKGEWGQPTPADAAEAAQEPQDAAPPPEGYEYRPDAPEAAPVAPSAESGEATPEPEDTEARCTKCGEPVLPDTEEPNADRRVDFDAKGDLFHAECLRAVAAEAS